MEAYQRVIDINGLTPPEEIMTDLEEIQKCRDNYVYPNKKRRQKYFNSKPHKDFTLPGRELTVSDLSDVDFMNWAMAYRIYGEKMFSSRDVVDWMSFKYLVRLKKIRFFSKILAIRTVEKNATNILKELVRSEMRIIHEKYLSALNTKPKIIDLKRRFLGMPSVFTNSTLNFGLRSYYENKSNDIIQTGEITDVNENQMTFQYTHDNEDFILVIEKYMKLKDKPRELLPQTDLPEEENDSILSVFSDRDSSLKGTIPISKFETIKTKIDPTYFREKNLSDFFGDLKFTYKLDIYEVFERIETGSSRTFNNILTPIILLNPELRDEITQAYTNFSLDLEGEGFEVFVSQEICDISDLEPSGTTGHSGVSYGIRIAISPNPDSTLYKNVNEDILESIEEARQAAEDAEEEFNLNLFIKNQQSNVDKAFIYNIGNRGRPKFPIPVTTSVSRDGSFRWKNI